MQVLTLAILPILVAAVVAFFVTPFVIKLAEKIGIVDDPAKNRHPKVIHTYPVPRGGGLVIFLSLLISALIFIHVDKHLIGILLGALVLTILGIVDDKYNLNPYLRLVICFVAAAIPVLSGIGIAFLANPFTGSIYNLSHPQLVFNLFGGTHSIWLLSDIFGLVWIVFLMNILNMGAKGVDGQLPGVAAIAAIIIAVLSLRFSADTTQWPIIILAMITAGAFLGFLPWNIFPQKIMPGFSGSTLAGYLLAILSILSTAKVGLLFVVLAIPLIDTLYTIVRRIAGGRSPVWGDRGHLHHRLLALGWSKTKVATFYWTITALLGILALNLNTSTKLYTIGGIALILGGLILWLKNLQTNDPG
jgi:UDP-GlcNAc:undecaprenyl-phosphate GlcNAc-1-phosphate transferase